MLIQYTASGLKFKLLATDNNNNNKNWSSQFGGVPEVLPTKQPVWDRPGNLVDKALVEASLNSPHSRSSFLAASSQHSGDWLFALLIASCGLKLDDEAVRVAVGLRLGLDLCVPHECHCSSTVDARGVMLGRHDCCLHNYCINIKY